MKINARGELDATGKDESGWAKDRRVDVSSGAEVACVV